MAKLELVFMLPVAHYLAAESIQLDDAAAGIGDDIVPAALGNKDRAAGGAGAVALPQLGSPAEHGVLGLDRRLGRDDPVVGLIAPEVGPIGGDAHTITGGRGFGQRNLHRAGVFTDRDLILAAHIAPASGGIAVGAAGDQGINTLAVRQDTLAGLGVIHHGDGIGQGCAILILYDKLTTERLTLGQLNGIGLGDAVGGSVAKGNGDGLGRKGRVQGQVATVIDLAIDLNNSLGRVGRGGDLGGSWRC